MKKKEIPCSRFYDLLFLHSFSFLAEQSYAIDNSYAATRFTCENNGNKLTFFLAENDQDYTFSYFDGKTIWSASDISKCGSSYSIDIVRAAGAGAGANPSSENTLKALSFTLPSNLFVKRYQSGGYYIPEYTYIPAQFSLLIYLKFPTTERKETLSCVGN